MPTDIVYYRAVSTKDIVYYRVVSSKEIVFLQSGEYQGHSILQW